MSYDGLLPPSLVKSTFRGLKEALPEDSGSGTGLRPTWATGLGGLWANPDVPLRGWRTEDIVPAKPGEVCEMCRASSGRRIAHAYLMHDPASGRRLGAGGSCAFRMETGQQRGVTDG